MTLILLFTGEWMFPRSSAIYTTPPTQSKPWSKLSVGSTVAIWEGRCIIKWEWGNGIIWWGRDESSRHCEKVWIWSHLNLYCKGTGILNYLIPHILTFRQGFTVWE